MLRVELRQGSRYLCNEQGEPVVRLRKFSEVAGSLELDTFVIASGPSTANFAASRFADYPFIAMNGSILVCTRLGLKPYFYLCDDDRFSRGRTELALSGIRSASHIAMSLDVLSTLYRADETCLKDKSVFLLEPVNRSVSRPRMSDRAYAWSIRKDPELVSNFSLFWQTPNRIGFSLNLDKGYFVARTIPYVALQLCYQLGAPRVFMVGVDMNQGGRFYENGEGALPTRLKKDYKKKILPNFRLMAERVVEKGRFEVFNLSLESQLPHEVIPKLDASRLESLLNLKKFECSSGE